MATKKKLLQAAAGQAGGGGLDVSEVFSTYLYEGTGSGFTITNGVDLTEGGLVWMKRRDSARDHALYDTERGVGRYLRSNTANAQDADNGTAGVRSFNSDGFTLGANDTGENDSGGDYVSWTFRKAEKFFDVVTYTGNGSNRTISHNLGTTPGMIIVKETSGTTSWRIWHRSLGNNQYIRFQTDAANADNSYLHWSSTAHTDTTFSVGTNVGTNNSGSTYVAYLFAHNDGDGEFGPDGDADIIKCGSYTGNGSTDGPDIDLGFEPQWVMLKNATTGNSFTTWNMYDNMRGVATGGNDARLFADQSLQEYSNLDTLRFNADGFSVEGSTSDQVNKSGDTYIYIAIRRGPMAVPESGSEVFAMDDETYTNLPQFYSGWPVDFALRRLQTNSTNFTRVIDRLRGNKYLNSTSTDAEASLTIDWDVMDGFSVGTSSDATDFSWMWKRAPNYFDVVAYSGNSTAGRTVSHNLGVAPEMMWVKARNASGSNWIVYHKDNGNNAFMRLESTSAVFNSQPSYWNSTTPTDTDFTVGTSTYTNQSGYTYIAYLFASLDGVSKVGSYTGDGSTDGSKVIDCGFSSGARFVLIKRTDNVGSWYVWDTERGIVVGNDPILQLNSTAAEVTASDDLVPSSSGFAVKNSGASVNINSATYIFYAIA